MFMMFFLFWAFATLQPTIAESAKTPAPIVFIHGIKGAKLVNPEGSLRYLSLWQGLGFSTSSLALPMQFIDGKQQRDDLRVDEILDKVGPVGLYNSFMDEAAKFQVPFTAFTYDWRRENLESVDAFIKFLEATKAKYGNLKVNVIAHSMGGLITLTALNRRPDLFERVVFVAVPFIGGIGLMPELHAGRSTGWNRSILSPPTLITFPSFLSVFPLQCDRLLDKNNKTIAVDLYDSSDWQRLKLGPFATSIPSESFQKFFAEALTRAKTFQQGIVKTAITYPPILAVAGSGFKTTTYMIQDGPEAELGWDFETAPTKNGDGLVSLTNVRPPAGIEHAYLEIKSDHLGVLTAPETIRAMRKFLAIEP